MLRNFVGIVRLMHEHHHARIFRYTSHGNINVWLSVPGIQSAEPKPAAFSLDDTGRIAQDWNSVGLQSGGHKLGVRGYIVIAKNRQRAEVRPQRAEQLGARLRLLR